MAGPPTRRSCTQCGLVYIGRVTGCRREHCPEVGPERCECGQALTDVHPASRADGRLEGTCPEHGHVVAA